MAAVQPMTLRRSNRSARYRIGSRNRSRIARSNDRHDLDTQFAVPSVLPEPSLPPGSPATLVEIAEKNRPEIAAAASVVSIAELSRASIDTDLLPQLGGYAAFGNQTSPTA